MEIQFVLCMIHLIRMALPPMPLDSFPRLSFSCRDIARISADTIVPKKREMESRWSSRSGCSEKVHLTLRFRLIFGQGIATDRFYER
jgi:hypothetical protein